MHALYSVVTMAFINCIILAVLAFGAFRGLRCGLVSGVAATAGLIVGVVACRLLGCVAYDALCSATEAETWPGAPLSGQIIACGLLYVLVVLLFKVGGGVLKSVLRIMLLGPVDRLLGALFGMLKYGFALSLILNVLATIAPAWGLQEGAITSPVMAIAPMAWGLGE